MPVANPAIGSVRYRPYLSMLADFDHSASFRVRQSEGTENFTDIAREFARDCRSVREEIRRNAKRYCSKAELQKQIRPRGPEDAYFLPFLHQPLMMGALGIPDDFCFMLSDTFSVIMRLAALHPAIENCEIGFVPRLDGLKSRYQKQIRALVSRLPPDWIADLGVKKAPFWPFYEPHELLDDADWVRFSSARSGCNWHDERSFPVKLRKTPLCVVTRFKLNISGMLNHGALLLDAAERAVIGSVQRVCLAYLGGKQSPPESWMDPIIKAKEILGLKIMLLEPIGADDLVLVSFCTNYAVAASIACALRSLTFDVLFEYAEDPKQFDEALRKSDVHQALFQDANKCVNSAPAGEEALWHAVAKNHLFMSTSSIFCFGHYATACPEKYEIGGYVQAHLRVGIGPGHEADILETLSEAHGGIVQEADRTDIVKQTYGFLPGQHDELLNLSTNPDPPSRFGQGEVISAAQYLRFIDRLFKTVNKEEKSETVRSSETGFLDMQTFLVARIPNFDLVIASRLPRAGQSSEDFEREREEIRSSVREYYPCDPENMALLPKVMWPQHGHGLEFFHALHAKVERHLGFVGAEKFSKLQRDLRKIGCPQSLQLPLIRLYQDFLGGLRDPLVCDATLTMFEAFVAVNSLLRKEMPAFLDRKYPDPISRRAKQAEFFELGSPIVEFLDSLQLAFALRFQGELPRGAGRHGAFHFRGGLSKLIAAVDVPLRCGVGFFRRLRDKRPPQDPKKFDESKQRRDDDKFKQRFAAVTSVGVEPRTMTSFFHFDKASKAARTLSAEDHPLSAEDHPLYFFRVNLDLAYLFRPEQILHSIHEIGHLVCETFAWANVDEFKKEYCKTDPSVGEFLHNRTSEIFTEFLSHLLLFGSDTELFSRTFAMEFGEIQGSIFTEINTAVETTTDAGIKEIHQRVAADLFEEMFTAFTVVELIKWLPEQYAKAPLCWSGPPPTLPKEMPSLEQAFRSFKKYITMYGPYYPGFNVAWDENKPLWCAETWKRCEAYFHYRYKDPARSDYLKQIWEVALTCISRFHSVKVRKSDHGRLPENIEEHARLDEAIRFCMEKGRTFQASQWPEGELDPFAVLCRLAYHYADLVYGKIEGTKVIYVDPPADPNAEPPDEGPTLKHNRFLLDHSRLPLFCPHPKMRLNRTRWQVAFFRTLWDLSSQLRSRRLMAMIHLGDTKE